MSDIKARADWTGRELLVYILSAMEHSSVKLDYTNAPVPVGRNVSGCLQRVNRLKKALKNDMDALKNGLPVSDTVATGKGNGTKGKNKRKAENGDGDAEGDEEKPKKRGRAKKTVEPEVEVEVEVEAEVKQEATPESEGLGEEVEV